MDLTAEEIRVLGCLIEKEAATPESYPLSTNALIAACNQKSNRSPVVQYDERTVDQALLSLRERELARVVRGGGQRVYKHRHVVDDAWGLDSADLAALAVLALRGPQTPGEVRSRAGRAHAFADLDEVDRVLEGLARREEPLVAQLHREPGQREIRYTHLLGAAAKDCADTKVSNWTGLGERQGLDFLNN